jgi:hypothetical protein
MTEFNNIGSYHDKVNNAYLNVRDTNNGGLFLEIHQRIGGKHSSLVLTKDQSLLLSKLISDHYK